MRIIKNEENPKATQHMRNKNSRQISDGHNYRIRRGTKTSIETQTRNIAVQDCSICDDKNRLYLERGQEKEVDLSCFKLRKTHGSYKNDKLLGLHRRRNLGSSPWGIFIRIMCLVIMMSPRPTTADYYQRYVSKAMTNSSRTACEKEYLYIECPEGTSIDILDAMYGRKRPSSELCPAKIEDGYELVDENTNCEAVTALEKAGAECQDRRLCQLLVYHRVFGYDPCPGTSKYLKVHYQCRPKTFQERQSCSDKSIRLRCRQGTVIGIYKVTPKAAGDCPQYRNTSNETISTCLHSSIFDDVSRKCHSKSKCSYSLPRLSCFNHVIIKHFCVPNSLLTSDIPTYDKLKTTVAPPPPTTEIFSVTSGIDSTGTKRASAVPPTVTIHSEDNGGSFDFSFTTSTYVPTVATGDTATENRTDIQSTVHPISSHTSANPASTSASGVVSRFLVTSSSPVRPDDSVIAQNDFPIKDTFDMDNSTNCTTCSLSEENLKFINLLRIFTFLQDNRQDMLIVVLIGVIVALLLTIFVLLCRREKDSSDKSGKDLDQITEETREDNRQNVEEHHSFQDVEQPAEEDEHENMSLLGSILQRSVDSNNTMNRPHASPNMSYVIANTKQSEKGDGGSEHEPCGPKSIFGRICCNCCCSNPPWQRTRILKRRRGDVYHVRHRYSSSIDDEDLAAEFRSHGTFPNMSRPANNPENLSPIAVSGERVNRTEQSILTTPAETSSPITTPNTNALSQSQQNFRPISRTTQRHVSVTPEPDSRHRIQRTFQPQHRQPETQRSDPALNRYTVRQQYNVNQPLTAPTSPVVGLHSNHTPMVNGAQHILHVFPPKSPKPVMGSSMLQASHPPPPQTPKYTPPPNHFFNTHQYPSFPETYEQYDNAPESSQVVPRKQFSPPRDYSSPYNVSYHGNGLANFPTTSNYDGDHFVQAVQYRNVPANARAIDLAANARTVDLSHNNTVSRNSWIEIRRSSIYDNSLPRNSEMFDYYQQFMPHDYQMPSMQLDLPGSRNLNHYYP